MAAERWALNGFEECLKRWVATEFPPETAVVGVTNWVTEKLPFNPHLRGAKRFNEDPTMRYVEMPFRSNEGRVPVIGYKLDLEERTITCVILGEFPGRPIYP